MFIYINVQMLKKCIFLPKMKHILDRFLKRPYFWLYATAFFLFVYLLLRSVFVPVLHDEVATFLIYIKTGNFFPKSAWPDANNHFLNSLGAWLMYQIAGNETWSLRFPNVLSSLLYFISVIGISRSLRDHYFRYGFVIVLFMTHGFLEFFAFARGYGMSMAFLMFSLWMIFDCQRKRKISLLILSVIALIPAITANLTLLPVGGMIFVYIIVLWGKGITKISIRHNMLFAMSTVLFIYLFTFFTRYSFSLKEMDLLYYGGEVGFFNAVLKTHAKMLFFSESKVVIYTVIALFFVGLILFFVHYFRKGIQATFNPQVTLFPLLLAGSLCVIFFLYFIMDVNYPEDRTSIYLYPFLIGTVFFMADLSGKKLMRLFLIPFVFVPLNFFQHLNLSYSFHWHYERIPVDFPEKVRLTSGEIPPGHVTISGYKIHELIWGYHVCYNAQGVSLLNPANYPNNIDDYVLLRPEESDTLAADYFKEYELIIEDRFSGLKLLKRAVPAQRRFLFETETIRESTERTDLYLNFFQDTLFDFHGKSLLFQFDIQFMPESDARGSVIVVSVRDEEHNNLQYQRIETDWLGEPKPEKISSVISVLNIPKEADGLVAYIWNKHEKKLKIWHAGVKVYELIDPVSDAQQKNAGQAF
jgi:hypothetical protein